MHLATHNRTGRQLLPANQRRQLSEHFHTQAVTVTIAVSLRLLIINCILFFTGCMESRAGDCTLLASAAWCLVLLLPHQK
jgi:hypothetical protein